VPESAIVRETALRFITRAGPEIGVASTKAFTTQLAAFALLTLALAKINGRLSAETRSAASPRCATCRSRSQKVLELEPEIEQWASASPASSTRSSWAAAALPDRHRRRAQAQGNLLHPRRSLRRRRAQARPAGPGGQGHAGHRRVPGDELLEKLKSNLQEVRARGGELYVFADAGSEIPESEGVHILHMPEHYGMLSPVLHVIPLQLLSYHAALVKGTDVDKPRNLAKSVTVE
jgi:glucosamine--fructose-6-phosphate aminotransferase (isomerizing)